LRDRLYLNDGTGIFTLSGQALPTFKFESTSCVRAQDFDQDGDQDLFVGVRLKPRLYGVPVNGYLLENDGFGNFTDVTQATAPDLISIGMISDATWQDIDNDQDQDLIVVGEWMPVKILVNNLGVFEDKTEIWGLALSNGWWNTIEACDIDQDGDIDFVLGNHGLNSRFKASREKPVTMLINDFDRNGTVEQILSIYEDEESYPVVLKHDLVMQIPELKKKYLRYAGYKEQTVEDIFTSSQLENALELKAYHLQSSILINQGSSFKMQNLPIESQFAPIYGIEVKDFDGDDWPDVLLGGNFFNAKPEVGRYDADYGLFLKGDGTGNFKVITAKNSGFSNQGQIRDLVLLDHQEGQIILVAQNNGPLQVFSISQN